MKKTVLVIAPHADDEVLGCGATMKKHALNGDSVHVLIATNASVGAPELFKPEQVEAIRAEALNAHRLLGVAGTHFAEFPAPRLSSSPAYPISNRIGELVRELAPEVVYLPHPGDLHEDHRVIYRSALVALRPGRSQCPAEVYCYETLSETEWAPVQGDERFEPNVFVDVSSCFEAKLEAMKCFQSQLMEFPHSRSLEALEALAKLRGATVHVARAEAFELERLIVR